MQTRPQVGKKVQKNYRRLHLPVDALAQNMFSHDVKRLRFWYQTLKFSHPINVKFPRQSFAVITVKNVRQICENPFTDISRAGKASGTQDFFREVGEDLFYMKGESQTTVVGPETTLPLETTLRSVYMELRVVTAVPSSTLVSLETAKQVTYSTKWRAP